MRQHKVRNLKFVWALGLVLLALFPTLVAVAQSNDDIIALPYIRNTYVQTQGCHPDGWGTDCAVDLAGGKGTPLYAPISGEVTFMIDDGYGNPTLFIENGRWKVIMLHAEFSIQSGQVNIGTQIGVESNMGYTKGAGGRFCGTGSNCGYHLHFDVYDKANRKWVNPLKVALPFDNDGVVQHLVSTVEDETQYFATSDSINWDEVGFSGTIITSSGENIVIQPTAAAPQPEPTAVAVQQQPETITVQLPNPKNPQTAQFILSWVMLMGLLVASGMLAFGGSSQTRVMGIILLIALILVGFWLYNQGFTTAFKPPSTVVRAATAPQSEPTPANTEERLAPRAETTSSITNVVLPGLPDISQVAPTAPSGECNGQLFAQLLAGSAYASATPPTERQDTLNTAISRITPELQAVYATAERETGVPCEVLAGIHFVEANNRPNGSLISGRTVGNVEPDRGGKVYSSLLETAIDASNILKAKAGGEITSVEQLISALSRYNGGGNANCNDSYPYTIPYSGCPKSFAGEDDPYATNWLDDRHSTMYLLYCADYTACAPQVFKRPGSFTVALWFYKGVVP